MKEYTKYQATLKILAIIDKTQDLENDADIFRFLNEVQSGIVDAIEDANNTALMTEVQRLAMYQISPALRTYYRRKDKEKDLHILVNLLCACVRKYENLYKASEIEKELFNILSTVHRDKILSDEGYYNRAIPESKWFIKYLKEMTQEV